MNELDRVIYHPCLRAGKYDLLALADIEEHRRPYIAPIISARGGDPKHILEFAQKWGDHYFWLDSSRFAQDTQDPLSSALNRDSEKFATKFSFYQDVQRINAKVLPVLGYRSGDSQRNTVQFGLSLLKNFALVALRIEGSGAVLDRNLLTAKAFLNAIGDEDLQRVVLIVDAWGIAQMPSLQDESCINKALALTKEYLIKKIILLSTSWPDDRPERGVNTSVICIDPFWQAIVKAQMAQADVRCAYGDYAATNPMKDLLDNYDPTKMAQPIPFAGYYGACAWHQERRGAGGENEQYREIAKSFRALPTYHGDEFCAGTRTIAAIATGQRTKCGNMAYWNKIRINQHICALLKDLQEGLLERLAEPAAEAPWDEDDTGLL